MPSDHPRHYSAEEKTSGVALAASIGPKKAAEQLGFPVRTVTYWMHQPQASPIIRAAETTIAERLAAAHEKALAAVLEGLDDPRARLSDRAAALRVLGEQRLLAEGRATVRSENLNLSANVPLMTPEDRDAAAEFVRALSAMSDDELRVWLASDGAQTLRAGEAEAARQIEPGNG
jgi:transposase-like protein